MPKSKEVTTTASGGLKGFFQRAGSSFKAGGILAKDYTYWLGLKGARVAFIFATTSIVVFMPLIFEISRESMVSTFSCHVIVTDMYMYCHMYCHMSLTLTWYISP